MLKFLLALCSSSVLITLAWSYQLTYHSSQQTPEQESITTAHYHHAHHHGHDHTHHQHPSNKGFECGTDELMARLHKKYPALLQRALQEEQLWQRQVQVNHQFNATGGVHTIPVVVHLVHNNGPANLTNPQVQAAIQQLNDAFANVGYYNPATGADTEIQFCLAQRDPLGNGTTGITRTISPLTTMDKNTDDAALKALIQWNSNDYINIWVVDEILGGTAGYAYLPSAHGNAVDGIVIEDRFMGFTPSETSVLVHEMGHYFGLYHTFEGGCTNNSCTADGDKVCDTPPDNTTARPPCTVVTNSCTSDEDDTSTNNPFRAVALGGQGDQPDQKENYMDYSDLACYDQFSQGQVDRMQFFLHGIRASLLASQGCQPACLSAPITAAFTPSALTTTAGTPLNFNNNSVNASNYTWYVDGVSFSTATNSSYNFPTVGTFWIKLEAGNGDPNCTQYDSIQITVFCAPPCGEICDNGIDDDGNGQIDCFDTACSCQTCSADEGSYWYFGDNAGLNFNSGSPVSLTNGRVRTSEASTTISDVNGNLLFYTDGITVWNRNHQVMANGTGLLGHSSTAQMVVVPKPNDPSIYYLFIPPMQNFTNGLTYSTIDLSLNGNLGAVTAKNVPVTNFKTTEGITAIKHCNNKDYWVIAKEWQTNRYIVVPVTSAGVSTTFLSQNIGQPHNNTGPNQNANAITIFRGSPDGNRLAVLFRVDRGYEIYDFDKSIGVLSNSTYWPTTSNTVPFGLEFSASGQFLYASTLGQWRIYQYDLTVPTAAAIGASSYLVTDDTRGGGIQMGPDQKIYRARNGETSLDVINNPDLQGAACNYQGAAINLSPRTSRLGLPNFIKEYVTQPIQSFLTGPTAICNGSTASIEQYTISDYQCNIDTVIWQHRGVNSINSTTDSTLLLHAAVTGTDTLMATLISPCTTKTDTLIIRTIISPAVDLGPDTSVCQNGVVSLNSGGGYQSCVWQDNSQDSIFTATESGKYWVTCTTFCGNVYTDTIEITIDTVPVVVYNDTTINAGDTLYLPTSSPGGYQHQWTPNYNISCDTCPMPYFNPAVTTTYYHIMTNSLGCVNLDSFTVTVINNCVPVVVLDSIENICGLIGGGYLQVQGANGLAPYSYQWSTGDTTNFIQNLLAGDYYVTLTDASNCVAIDTFSIVLGTIPAVDTLLISDPNCGGNNGSILITVASNTQSYLWSTGDTSTGIINLAAGTYGVTLTSAEGCTASYSYALNNGNAPSIQLDSLKNTCGSADGFLQVQGLAGTTPYSYQWSTGGGSDTLQNLAVGTYYLTLTDASNCAIIDSFAIDTALLPQVVNAQIRQPTCGLDNGQIALNTLATASYTWSTGDSTAVVANLAAGIYEVTLTSPEGCTDTALFSMLNIPPPNLQVDTVIRATCDSANGSITLQVPSPSTTYNYQWSTGDTTAQLSNLLAGTYGVTVSDNNNCQDSLLITVTGIPTPNLAAYINTVGVDSAFLNKNQAFFVGAGTDERPQGVQYTWVVYGGQGITLDSTVNVPNTTGTATDTGLYRLVVRAFDTTCAVEDTLWLQVLEVNFLGLPNAFTPNGDGQNDQFSPIGLSAEQVLEFRIYNRWGNVVHDAVEGVVAWDGNYQGMVQPSDTYIYYLSYQLPGGEVTHLKGKITLIR